MEIDVGINYKQLYNPAEKNEEVCRGNLVPRSQLRRQT